MIYNCLLNSFFRRMKRNLYVSGKNYINHVAMLFIFILCSTLTFSHTVTGSPGYGALCPISDTEYIDTHQNTVNEYYECPDPFGDQELTTCCMEEEEEPSNQYISHEEFIERIKKGDTRHKCCKPPIALDSVLKVDIRIAMILSLTVIVICVITGAAVIICCFVSSCPMYDTCSGSWNDKSSAGSLFLGDRNGMKLPGGGDYMPAADMHPESLNNGVNYWDQPTNGGNNHIQLKNHKLPANDEQARHDAQNANHV